MIAKTLMVVAGIALMWVEFGPFITSHRDTTSDGSVMQGPEDSAIDAERTPADPPLRRVVGTPPDTLRPPAGKDWAAESRSEIREQWARALREKASAEQRAAAAEAATVTALAKARDGEQQADRLAAQLAAAQRDLAERDPRMKELERQLDGAREKIADVERELGGEREQRSRMLADEEAAERRAAAAQADATSALAEARDGTERADRLSTQLAQAQRGIAERDPRLKELQQQLDSTRDKMASLERDLASARAPRATPPTAAAPAGATAAVAAAAPTAAAGAPPADPARAGSPAPTQTPAPTQAAASSQGPGLPEFEPARIVLRYTEGNRTARTHAVALSMLLQAKGLEVSGLVPTATRIATDAVTYFYAQDHATADGVASVLDAPAAVRNRPPAAGQPPRPGTVEVAVAG